MSEANQLNRPSQQSHLDAPPSLIDLLDRMLIGRPEAKNLPKPDSLLQMKDETKATVLLSLLEQNREEIRFWHEKMFQASFALNSAMVVVAGFVLHEPGKGVVLSWLAAIACLVFVVFHLIVGRLGAGAIRINGRDLEFIQAALRLAEPGDYVKDKPIYGWTGTEWIPQRHFVSLHVLNWVLAIGLIVTLLCRIYG